MDCGDSSILPNGACTALPFTPTDGQVFVDNERVKWVYDAELDLWQRSGTADVVPLATSDIIGYMSYLDKSLLDQIPAVPGGFGIITDTKLLLQSPTNPEGVIRGDIELVSESLDIECVSNAGATINCLTPPGMDCETNNGQSSGLSFKLSDKFLNSLLVNIPGQQGKKGPKGNKGNPGKPGFAGGPAGRAGRPGPSISELCRLTGVKYNDLDGVTDTAIVDLGLIDDDGHGCKLVVTKAKLNVPGDAPADKVIATPLIRGVVYDADDDPENCKITRLDDWRLVKPVGDDTPLNIQLLRLSTGSEQTGQPSGFNASMTIKKFISDIVKEYKQRLAKVDRDYGKVVKSYIESIDSKARDILSSLANDLTQCEFDLPAVEYCITFTGCGEPSVPPPPPSPAAAAAGRAGEETFVATNGAKVRSVKMGGKKWDISQ